MEWLRERKRNEGGINEAEEKKVEEEREHKATEKRESMGVGKAGKVERNSNEIISSSDFRCQRTTDYRNINSIRR